MRTVVPEESSLEALGPLEDLEQEWRPLAERAGNFFSTWEFATTWWRHFGGNGELRLLGMRGSDGRLRAIVPLYRSRLHGVRTLRLLGHGVADQLDLICGDSDRVPLAGALRSHLRSEADWEVCLLERLPAEHGWQPMLKTQMIRQQTSPILRVGGLTWDGFLGGLSSNHRGQVRRRERKLVREHGLRFRLATDPDRLGEDLDRLFELHDANWGSRSSGFASRWKRFHHDFAQTALERGWLRLWFAEISGETAAAWYGFRFANSEWYYQAGRDPRFDEQSVGGVLLAHTIRSAIEDGVDSYRFLLGDEAYKSRFPTIDSPVDTQAIARGSRGRLVLGATRTAAKTAVGRRAIGRVATGSLAEPGPGR